MPNLAAIVAFDCAIATGWAVAKKNGAGWKLVESGVQTFDLRRGESPGLRFLRFRNWLKMFGLHVGEEDSLAVYEQAHHRGGAATELCVGFTTRVAEWAAEIGAQHAAVHTGTLKKSIAGNGSAGKPEMMRKAAEIWGVTPADDNEADALCLLKYAIDNYG